MWREGGREGERKREERAMYIPISKFFCVRFEVELSSALVSQTEHKAILVSLKQKEKIIYTEYEHVHIIMYT